MKPRSVVPAVAWLLLAIASFVAAVVTWQSQRLEQLRPPTSVATEPAASPAPMEAAPEPPQPAAPPRPSAPATPGNAAAALRPSDPAAGRQVLRCVSKGRVSYRDLNAGCPDGSAEKITVFPTDGVGKPQ